MTTLETVKQILCDNSPMELWQIKDDTRLEASGMDSLDHVQFVMGLEEEFHIGISDEDAEPLLKWTVEDVSKFVQGKMGKRLKERA